jgi:hypothetical protein
MDVCVGRCDSHTSRVYCAAGPSTPGYLYWAKTPIQMKLTGGTSAGMCGVPRPSSQSATSARARPSISVYHPVRVAQRRISARIRTIGTLFTSVYFRGAKSIIVPTTTHTSYSHPPLYSTPYDHTTTT